MAQVFIQPLILTFVNLKFFMHRILCMFPFKFVFKNPQTDSSMNFIFSILMLHIGLLNPVFIGGHYRLMSQNLRFIFGGRMPPYWVYSLYCFHWKLKKILFTRYLSNQNLDECQTFYANTPYGVDGPTLLAIRL